MSVDRAPELRLGRWAGIAALASVLCLFGALVAAAKAAPASVTGPLGSRTGSQSSLVEQLRDFHHAHGLQSLALGFKVVAFLLVVPVALFLQRATRARRPGLSRWVARLGVAGAVLVAASAISGFFALSDVADSFVRSGAETSARAKDLASSSGFLRASALFEIGSRVLFAVWLAWASYAATQAALLTRFLGVLGIGAAVAGAILLPASETFFVAWLGSVGILVLGWWPGGRPEGWNVARAAP